MSLSGALRLRLPPDTPGLVARRAFPVSQRRYRREHHAPSYAGRRYYVHAYLWASYDAMEAALGPACTDLRAAHQAEPYLPWEPPRPLAEGIGQPHGPKLGNLHFVVGTWGADTVAHEALHATLWLHRIAVASGAPSLVALAVHDDQQPDDGPDRWHHGTPEEEAAYAHGLLVGGVLAWLWEVDPNPKWKRLG